MTNYDRLFYPLAESNGRVVGDAGPNGDEPGYAFEDPNGDTIDLSLGELYEMLAAVEGTVLD